MHSEPIQRTVVFDETVPSALDGGGSDLAELRDQFQPPFERAAHAVQVLGFEQDDAIIERRLRCQLPDGSELEVAADFLGDAVAFREHLRRAIGTTRGAITVEHCRIVGLRVVAILERWGRGSGPRER